MIRMLMSTPRETWDVGNMKKVVVRNFMGKTAIDIREYYVNKNTMDIGHQAWEEGHCLEPTAVPETQVSH